MWHDERICISEPNLTIRTINYSYDLFYPTQPLEEINGLKFILKLFKVLTGSPLTDKLVEINSLYITSTLYMMNPRHKTLLMEWVQL